MSNPKQYKPCIVLRNCTDTQTGIPYGIP